MVQVMLTSCSTKRVYEEDSAERYMVIEQVRRGGVSGGAEYEDGRPDLHSRRATGPLWWVFSEIAGYESPLVTVESSSETCYHVVFQFEDPDALQIVADKLGLEVVRESRVAPALVLRVAENGPTLEPSTGPRERRPDTAYAPGEMWLTRDVTIDELALYLQTEWRRPVVNATGIEGRWDIPMTREIERAWNGMGWDTKAAPTPVGQTGLTVGWEEIEHVRIIVRDRASDD